MSRFDGWLHRLRVLFRPGVFEREMLEEMRFHEDLDAMQQRDELRARRRFGNRTYYQEEARRMTWLSLFDSIRQDLGYAWRSIRRTPGFTVMVVVTLALGIGVNAATFAVLDRLYFRAPAGIADSDGVRRVWFQESGLRSGGRQPQAHTVANFPMYQAVKQASARPVDVAAYDTDFSIYLRRDGAKVRMRGVFATANYFSVLGVRPAFGRLYSAAEDSMGMGRNVAVLGHRFWATQLGGDSSVVGSVQEIEGTRYTIIGVLPEEFTGLDLQASDVWIPMASIPSGHWIASHDKWWERVNTWSLEVIRRAASPEEEQAYQRRATAAIRESNLRHWPRNPDTLMNVLASGLVDVGPGTPGQTMVISSRLGVVAAIVLLVACANVVNLLLARTVRRRREIAVRLALGISRGRLARMLTAETLLLASIAAMAALLAAWWGGALLRSLLLPEVTWYDSALDGRVVVFALLVALVAGVVSGIIPAFQASNPELTRSLKEGARDGTAHRSRLRQGLIVAQAAFSIVLLAGAALFVQSLRNVRGLDIGYDSDRLLFGWVTHEDGEQPASAVVAASMAEVARRIETRPGIQSVALAYDAPMRSISFMTFFWGSDSSARQGRETPTWTPVSPSYFRTVGLRMLRGTPFDDGAAAPRQMVVNEAMARLLWPQGEVLGQCVRFQTRDAPCYTVVGVTENARLASVIEEDARAQYYLPHDRLPVAGYASTTLMVRSEPSVLTAATSELSSALREAFPTAEVTVRPMMTQLEPEYRPWRLGATLFTAFGMLALIVAMIGIYSSVSYGVSQRTQEFGVRLALGARIGNVLGQVVGEGLRVVAVGVALGIALALASGKFVSALLYGIEPSDPRIIVFVSLALLAIAAVAAVVPAVRAARVDPVIALRAD